MGDLLSIPDVAEGSCHVIFGRLTPEEVVNVMPLCCQALPLGAPYRSALAFALTRARIGDGCFCMSTWAQLWAGCAAAAEQEGLSASAFARALDVATDDPFGHLHECFKHTYKVPHAAAGALLRLAWERVQTGGSGFASPSMSRWPCLFVQKVDRYGEPCAGEPRWMPQREIRNGSHVHREPIQEELAAVLAMQAYHTIASCGSIFKIAGLFVLDDGQFVLLWTVWCVDTRDLSILPKHSWVNSGCAMFIGSNAGSLIKAARREFHSPVWELGASGRLLWAEYADEDGAVCASYGPHNYCTVGKRTEGAVSLVRLDEQTSTKFVRIAQATQLALWEFPKTPTAHHTNQEGRLACILNQSSSDNMFCPGDEVFLCGLVARPDLNERRARLRVLLGSRWSADVEGLTVPVSLKPANLIKVEICKEEDAREDGEDHADHGKEKGVEEKGQAVEPIIMEIDHVEPAAVISASESSNMAHELWAQGVECILQATAQSVPDDDAARSTGVQDGCSSVLLASSEHSESAYDTPAMRQSDFGETIWVLRWTRNPLEFEEALRGQESLEPVRAAAEAVGRSWLHTSGASIFVYPKQYESILALVACMELRPYHVVVNEAFKPFVLQAARQVRSKANVRLRSEQRVALIASGGSDDALVVERTFLTLVSTQRLRGPGSTTQSDPVRGTAGNPRACEAVGDS